MDQQRFRRCREVFEHALDLEGSVREAFLDQECGGDPALRDAVLDMLAADSVAERRGAFAAGSVVGGVGLDLVDQLIGGYRIIRAIASGGMGAVYEAEQQQPRRRVALKVLRSALPTAAVLRRFTVEAEILAALHHRGIARIIESGVHRLGDGAFHLELPWYAMELLEGAMPITEFAAAQRLGLAARVDLVIEVCDAVQHAHGRGVIHRDLKPGNVLVDHSGQPKVIDFGVARHREAGAAPATLLTAQGELIGTPAYMAPEQMTGDPDTVDIRADVYALGMLAYELCCGRLPFEIAGRGVTEILQMVRVAEPLAPRRAAPATPLELEWILLRALRKDPGERFASAAELRDDLLRFRRHEPVVSGPPGTVYRLRKFVRRHRLGVGAAAVVLVALVAGLATSLVALGRARDAEQQAVREGSVAQRVVQLLGKALQQARVEQRGRDVKVVDVLQEIAADESLADEPWVDAKFREDLGELYYSLGDLPAAEQEMRKAFDALQTSEHRDSADAVAVASNLVQILVARGRPADALALLDEVVPLADRVLPADDRRRLYLGQRRGAVLLNLRRLDDAEVQFRKTHSERARILGATAQDTLESLNSLSVVVAEFGRLEEAEELTGAVVEGLTALHGADHAFTLQARENRALLVRDRGDKQAALELLEPLAEAKARLHGVNHHTAIQGRLRCLEIRASLGEHERVASESADLLAVAESVLGIGHPTSLAIAGTRCRAQIGAGCGDAAIETARAAIAAAGDAQQPPVRFEVASLRTLLGRALAATDPAAAESELARGIEDLRAFVGDEHRQVRDAEAWLTELTKR